MRFAVLSLCLLCTQFLLTFQTAGFFYGFPRICLCRCGVSQVYKDGWRTGRVMGGNMVIPHEFPWLAAVNIGSQVIPGSLLSDRYIITAASPLDGMGPSNLIVTLGAHDRCTGPALNVSVASVMLHPRYSPNYMDYNIALLRLKHAIAFSDYVSPICLPFFRSSTSEAVVWVASWTHNNSMCVPQVVMLPILSEISCFKSISDSKLVASDKGCVGSMVARNNVCKDDVGAPVMSRWMATSPYRLHGVISTSSCDTNGPALYTRIADHAAWIFEHIQRDCQCL